MGVEDLVRNHYGGADLEEMIFRGLRDAGADPEALTLDDLAAVDQLHAGFLPATRYLLDQLALAPATRLLDVGCGIGGPARVAAEAYGCPVVGIDLSPDFIRVARVLTERVGLAERVEHQVAGGSGIDFGNESFDRAMMIHVGMNIADKASVFAEIRRVLRPGGTFGLYEQMRTGRGPLTYPLPWAEDDRSSFAASPQAYAADLEAAGFVVERTEDRTPAPGGPPGPPGPPPRLSPAAVFGPEFAGRLANNIADARAGRLAPVVIIARAD